MILESCKPVVQRRMVRRIRALVAGSPFPVLCLIRGLSLYT